MASEARLDPRGGAPPPPLPYGRDAATIYASRAAWAQDAGSSRCGGGVLWRVFSRVSTVFLASTLDVFFELR